MSRKAPNHPRATEQPVKNVQYSEDYHTDEAERVNPKELQSSEQAAKKMKQYTK